MTVPLDRTVIYVRDRQESATFFTSLFGLPDPVEIGQFLSVSLHGGATLDFAPVGRGLPVVSQRYAFVVSDREFDRIVGRMADDDVEHWADARGEFTTVDDGARRRGVHVLDPSGHRIEVTTRPSDASR